MMSLWFCVLPSLYYKAQFFIQNFWDQVFGNLNILDFEIKVTCFIYVIILPVGSAVASVYQTLKENIYIQPKQDKETIYSLTPDQIKFCCQMNSRKKKGGSENSGCQQRGCEHYVQSQITQKPPKLPFAFSHSIKLIDGSVGKVCLQCRRPPSSLKLTGLHLDFAIHLCQSGRDLELLQNSPIHRNPAISKCIHFSFSKATTLTLILLNGLQYYLPNWTHEFSFGLTIIHSS